MEHIAGGGSTKSSGAEQGILSPWAKFGVGALAAAVAFLSPMLLPVVTRYDVSGILSLLTKNETVASLLLAGGAVVWCAVIGLIVMLVEWGKRASPGETFFRALGLPAVLAGVLAATSQSAANQERVNALNNTIQVQEESAAARLRHEAENAGIPPIRSLSKGLLLQSATPAASQDPPAESGGAPPDQSGIRGDADAAGWVWWPRIVSIAHAQQEPTKAAAEPAATESAGKPAPENPDTAKKSGQAAGTDYVIVLKATTSKAESERFLDSNIGKISSLKLIEIPPPDASGKSRYMVLYDNVPVTEKKAIETAIYLKTKLKLTPEIVKLVE